VRHLRALFVLVGMLGLSLGSAQARPVTDCPLRDMPFSAASPFIDLLMSEKARAILDSATSGRIEKLPARFLSTKAPTFAAILTLREVGAMSGLRVDQVAAIDKSLRALKVTSADKVARCSRYDNTVPELALPPRDGRPRLLVFGKMTGFKDEAGFKAAQSALEGLAQKNGWVLATTDFGGAMNARTLRQFDAIIWNNNSGDVLTLSQRKAMRKFIENGGGFAAVHGAAGDPNYFWDWFADELIGARFVGHTFAPQFQEAVLRTSPDSPLAKAAGLPDNWSMTDEWYSFRTSPRKSGANVVVTLDESSYKPIGPMGIDIRMRDHPIAWTKCVGKGRMFYSAIGHKPESYAQPQHLALLEAAVGWVSASKSVCHASAGN